MLKRYAICLLYFLMMGCSDNKPVVSSVNVSVEKMYAHDIAYIFNYPAMVQGVVDYPVIPRVSGVLFKQLYKEGTMVKKGQPLAEIDPRPFEFQLKAYEGQLIKDKAARDNYQRIYIRYVDLYQYKAVSKQDVENARIDYEAALGNVKTDEANIKQTKLSLRYCLVRSPADGFIAERTVTPGMMVTAFQTVINHINSSNEMYLLFSMPENQRLEIEEGLLDKTIKIPANNTFSLDIMLADGKIIRDAAHVEFTDTRIGLNNGAWNMRGYVNNQNIKNKLLSGQYVTVYLRGTDYLKVFDVPQEAVMQDDKGAFVYVVDGEKAVKRFVTTGKMFDHNRWMITQGLKEGDKVITKGNLHLSDSGQIIKIEQEK